MASYIIQDTTLTAIADAIRSATGTSTSIRTDAFADSISYLNDFLNIVSRPSTFTVFSNPLVKKVGTNLLRENSRITEINLPNCDAIDTYACHTMSNLTSVSLPACRHLWTYAFCNCPLLTEINLPNLIWCGYSPFRSCSNLVSVSLPVCSSFGTGTFILCSKLSNLTLPSAEFIGHQAFNSCFTLTSLTLPGSSIPQLAGTNAFYSTPMSDSTYTGSFGSIYVPYSLVDAYKSATNWATYADRITYIPMLEWIAADQGYSNKQEVKTSSITDDSYNTILNLAFSQGTGTLAPTYYTTGTALRLYRSNTVTITNEKTDYIITRIIFVCSSSGGYYFTNTTDMGANIGTIEGVNADNYTLTWKGAADSVVLTASASMAKAHARIAKIQIELTKK